MDIFENCEPDWVLLPIKYTNEDLKDNEDFHFWCSGCDGRHVIRKKGKGKGVQAEWEFNDDLVKPTFSPSYLTGWSKKGQPQFSKRRCHSFIKDGMIRYLSDCYHKYAGQTISLPLLKDWKY